MRHDVKSQIWKRILSFQEGYRQNIGIIGGRGTGKTQIISEILQECASLTTVIPVSISAQALDFDKLCNHWAGRLLRGLFVSQSVMPPSEMDSLLQAAEPIIPKSVEKIRQIRRTLSRDRHLSARELFHLSSLIAEETGKKIILVIEEVQALTDVLDGDVFGALGREIMLEKDTLFIFTSSEPKLALDIFKEKLALLFNQFEIFKLGPLELSEGLKRISELGLSKVIPENLTKFIFYLTGLHPLYLDRIIASLSRHRFSDPSSVSERLSDSYVNALGCAVLEELGEPMGALSLIFEHRLESAVGPKKERSLSVRALLAVSEGYAKASEVALLLNRKVTDAKKILARLVDSGILSQNGTLYLIEDFCFSYWLREIYAYRFGSMSSIAEIPDVNFSSRFYAHFQHFLALTGTATHEKRLEQLLKKFHNDRIELSGRKYLIPAFSEYSTVSIADGCPLFIARFRDVRWAFRIFSQQITDRDVTLFLLQTKQMQKRVQKRIVIALAGLEDHARLLAHELKIQIWQLGEYNELLRLVGFPEILPDNFEDLHESTLGSVAEKVHSA